jgi:hypothetical protein
VFSVEGAGGADEGNVPRAPTAGAFGDSADDDDIFPAERAGFAGLVNLVNYP